jgi:hypothetical protein
VGIEVGRRWGGDGDGGGDVDESGEGRAYLVMLAVEARDRCICNL